LSFADGLAKGCADVQGHKQHEPYLIYDTYAREFVESLDANIAASASLLHGYDRFGASTGQHSTLLRLQSECDLSDTSVERSVAPPLMLADKAVGAWAALLLRCEAADSTKLSDSDGRALLQRLFSSDLQLAACDTQHALHFVSGERLHADGLGIDVFQLETAHQGLVFVVVKEDQVLDTVVVGGLDCRSEAEVENCAVEQPFERAHAQLALAAVVQGRIPAYVFIGSLIEESGNCEAGNSRRAVFALSCAATGCVRSDFTFYESES
jgi:hypothetical protein